MKFATAIIAVAVLAAVGYSQPCPNGACPTSQRIVTRSRVAVRHYLNEPAKSPPMAKPAPPVVAAKPLPKADGPVVVYAPAPRFPVAVSAVQRTRSVVRTTLTAAVRLPFRLAAVPLRVMRFAICP